MQDISWAVVAGAVWGFASRVLLPLSRRLVVALVLFTARSFGNNIVYEYVKENFPHEKKRFLRALR